MAFQSNRNTIFKRQYKSFDFLNTNDKNLKVVEEYVDNVLIFRGYGLPNKNEDEFGWIIFKYEKAIIKTRFVYFEYCNNCVYGVDSKCDLYLKDTSVYNVNDKLKLELDDNTIYYAKVLDIFNDFITVTLFYDEFYTQVVDVNPMTGQTFSAIIFKRTNRKVKVATKHVKVAEGVADFSLKWSDRYKYNYI